MIYIAVMSDPESDRTSGRDGSEKRNSLLERLVGETAILAATTGLFFLLGYLFLVAWMDTFNVDVWALDFPSYTPLIYSFMPLLKVAVWGFEAFAYSVLLIVLLANLLPRARVWSRNEMSNFLDLFLAKNIRAWLKPFALGAFVILVFVAMITLAIQLAKNYANHQYSQGTPVRLVFAANARSSLELELTRANDSGNLRLLIQTKDLVIVFEKPKSQLDKSRSVFVLRRMDLASVHSWSQHPE